MPNFAARKRLKPKKLLASSVLLLGFLFCSTFSIAEDISKQQEQSREELQKIQAEISISEQRKLELAEEIEQLTKDRETLNRKLIDTTTNTRELNKQITLNEDKLLEQRKEQTQIRGYLNSKKELLAQVLGALQRMGRNPPPALLVSPQDALSSVHSSILLGAVVPEMRAETELLLSQLNALKEVAEKIEVQRTTLTADLGKLAQEEERLNLLLVEKRNLAGKTQAQLADEQAKAADLASKATSLNDLISKLEEEVESARLAALEAKLAEEKQKLLEEERTAALNKLEDASPFKDASRISPAIAFTEARGLLPLPVQGKLLANYGENDGAGDKTKGLSLETRQNVRVSSPTDGWIIYAGPFRSYGQLLIINAGQGYHIVLAGMKNINVQSGQFVLVGEPIGAMGSQRIASANLVDVNTTKPILYVELRKDGKSIDPSPWWSVDNIERASNGS